MNFPFWSQIICRFKLVYCSGGAPTSLVTFIVFTIISKHLPSEKQDQHYPANSSGILKISVLSLLTFLSPVDFLFFILS